MDTNDDVAAERIMKLLKANGYLVSKNDVLWVLDRMTEEIDKKVTEAKSILERKFFYEVITTSQEIRIITELPDVSEEDINIRISDNDIFINAEGQKRSYYEVVSLPIGVSNRGLKSTFLNGVLEIRVQKRDDASKLSFGKNTTSNL
jgi:HSP20 family molecular chaperone IbpA